MPHSPVRTPHSPVRPVFGRFAGDPYHESEYNLRIETPRRRSRSLSKRLSGGHTPPADGPADGATRLRNRSSSPATAPRGEWHETPASLDELQVRHRELALLAAECERQKDDLLLRQEYLGNFRKQLAEEEVQLKGRQGELQQRVAELAAKEAALREREAQVHAQLSGTAGAARTDGVRTDWQTAESVDDLTVSSCSTMPTAVGRPSGVEDATVVSMPPPSARYGPIGPLREALAHAENKADFWERKWMQLMREVQERDEVRLSAVAVAVQVDLPAEEQLRRQSAFQQWTQGCEARKAAWQAEEKHWEDRLQYLQNVVRATEIESKSGPPTPTPRPLSPIELRQSFDVPSPVSLGLPPATPPPRSARIARGASPSPRFSTGSYYGSPRVGAAERGKSVGPDALLTILMDLDIPHFSGGTQDPKLEKKVEKQKKKIEKRIAKDRKKQEENARKEAKEELKLLQKSARGGREHGVRLE